MFNFDDAYRSLAKGKEDLKNLESKKEILEGLYDTLKPYCTGYGIFYKGKMNLNDIKNNEVENRREAFGLIIFALLLFTIGIGLFNGIFILISKDLFMVPISIFVGFLFFFCAIYNPFKEFKKSNKKVKDLDNAIDILAEYSKLKDKSLEKILKILEKDKMEIEALLTDLNKSINEYTAILDQANNELAEKILESSGIEANVNLSSSMKVLAKRMN